jgi:hypothetical protein
VSSWNHDTFDEIAGTALEEETAIVSKFDRYKNSYMQLSNIKCNNCGKNGHVASKCYLKENEDVKGQSVF